MRKVAVTVCLFLTVACDPGASFALVTGSGRDASWLIQGDSVHGRVHASAFTITFDVDAVLDAPADVTLDADSAGLEIKDVAGLPLQLEQFIEACQDSTSPPPSRSKRCIFGRANLNSTNYDRLDSVTVRFGYAVAKGERVPLIARFARVK